MTRASAGKADVPQFGVELRQAFVYELGVSRRARTEADDDKPSLGVGPQAFSHDSDKNTLTVLIGGEIRFPFGEDAVAMADVKCSVFGVFSYHGQMDPEVLRVFPTREGLIILWPYLRSGIAQIAGMTGLQLPPLPTLDVVALTNAPTAEAVPLAKG